MATQKIKVFIWALYYDGRFSHYAASSNDMSEQQGWIIAKEEEIEFSYNEKVIPVSKLVAQIDNHVEIMRSTAEMAIQSKLEEKANLLCLNYDQPAEEEAKLDESDSDDIPF